MDSIERVLRTLEFKETDRVPFGIFGTGATQKNRITKDLGCKSVEEMHKLLGLDIWHVEEPLKYIGKARSFRGKSADFWGVPRDIDTYGDTSDYNPLSALESISEVEAYDWPSIDDFDATWLDKQLELHKDFAIEGGLWAPFFHNFIWLSGFENALALLVEEPEVVHAILRKIMDFWISYVKKVLETAKGRIHIMQNCNDFGTQLSLLVSHKMFCEFFKPELKRLYDTIKHYDVAVMQHSCGNISQIIPDLIEIGADVINPVQVNAQNMEIEGISKKYAGKVVFYGGIDTQRVLPEGPEERIRKETRKTLDAFREKGGYILAPSQGIEADVLTAHVYAVFDEGKSYKTLK